MPDDLTPRRDVAAFDERAPRYETGWRGRMHHDIATRSADLALRDPAPAPERILDVGCGTGFLLGLLAARCPTAIELAGIDAAPAMVAAAAAATARVPGVQVRLGVAEALPYPERHFDLVVSTTSFDHWRDQGTGLAECRRVLRPSGRLVLVDQFSVWLAPTLVLGRRGKARTPARANRLLDAAGFVDVRWHHLYATIIRAVTARRPD